jgi:aminoglycoside phosphotransferase (APT) family kinase protein
MPELQLLASGLHADVFALDARRVLRRYRIVVDVTREAETMAHVAGYGFPVPDVFAARGGELVMERLEGPTLLQALAAETTRPREAAEIMADLHRRLHAVPPRGDDPGSTVVHLDLHLGNVMLTPRGPVVIDWTHARDGAGDVDVALSAVILAEVVLDNGGSGFGAAAREVLVRFLANVGADPSAGLAAAMAHRRADPALRHTEEKFTATGALVAAVLQGTERLVTEPVPRGLSTNIAPS